MNSWAIVPLTALLINLSFYSAVFAGKEKKPADRAFLFFTGMGILWCILVFVIRTGIFGKGTLLLLRASYSINFIFPFFVIHFVYTLLNLKKRLLYYTILILNLVIALIVIIAPVITDYRTHFYGPEIHSPQFSLLIIVLLYLAEYALAYFIIAKKIVHEELKLLKTPLCLFLLAFSVRIVILVVHIFLPDNINLNWFESGTAIETVIFFFIGKNYRIFNIAVSEIMMGIFQNIKDAIIIIDNKKIIQAANPAAEKLLNRKENKLNGCGILEILPQYQSEMDNYELEITIDNGKKNKQTLIFQSPIEKEGKKLGHVLFISDISEHKKLEKAVKEAEDKFQIVVESALDPIVMFSPFENKVLFANNAFFELFGYEHRDLNQISVKDIMPVAPISSHELHEMQKELEIKGNYAGTGEVFEIKLAKKSGKVIDVISSNSFVSFRGTLVVVSVIKDITERKQMEEDMGMMIIELERANNELKDLSKMKDDFLAVASHDMRSPFNGILGFIEILLSDNEIKDENRKYLTLIQESAENQLRYVNDILDILKFESGEIKIKPEKANIEELILTSLSGLSILAQKKNITIETEFLTDKAVYLDVPKISQVLNNLISNAIKFTPENGTLTVKTLENKNHELEIHVIDSGIGIPEDALPKLFKMYQQVHRSGTAGEKGTGLGLSICKKLVEAHKGRISVSSEVNKGSDFHFTLPL